MTTPCLVGDVGRDEGCRLVAYPDPDSRLAIAQRAGKPTAGLSGAPWTIGYGHTGAEVHPGLAWTQGQADGALAADVGLACRGLDASLPWWRQLSDPRQDVLANMAFNLGVEKLATFASFLAFVKGGQFAHAALDMLGTAWAHEVGARAQRLSKQMASGVRQSPT